VLPLPFQANHKELINKFLWLVFGYHQPQFLLFPHILVHIWGCENHAYINVLMHH